MSEWIMHDGGPCPLAQNTLLSGARFWDGREFSAAPSETSFPSASEYDWRYLVAYRLAQPKPAIGADKAIMDGIARRYEGEPLARDMTKRERFAMAAMQGMLACPTCSGNAAEFARNAVEHADALLAALEVQR